MGRKKESISYGAIKEKADKERELQGKIELEKERNEKSAEEELKEKLLLVKDEDERAKKRMKVERSKELMKSRQEVAAQEEFDQEIFRRKDELDRELKRMKMEKNEERTKEAERKNLREKILRREKDLDRASLVKNWKASAAKLPPSTPNENPTMPDKILEAAKRGPKHDLCEGCGSNLQFCVHEECTIIGCSECFMLYFTNCFGGRCFNFVCEEHCMKCFACGSPHCNQCEGKTCEVCERYTCGECYSDAKYCCNELKDMCEKYAESLGHSFSNP